MTRRERMRELKRIVAGFMEAWMRAEHAPRVTCAECQFESSEGYAESHARDCSHYAHPPQRGPRDAR